MIGRVSTGDVGLFFFSKGFILITFQLVGKIPFSRDELKISIIANLKFSKINLRNLMDTPSWPIALLVMF